MDTNINTKNAPKQIVDWLDRSNEVTGLSKEAIVLAAIMDTVTKAGPMALPAPADEQDKQSEKNPS